MLIPSLTTPRRAMRDERGSMLVSVLVIMTVLTIGGLVVAAVVVNTTGIAMSHRSTAESRAAADAGLADVVALAQSGEDICTNPTGRYAHDAVDEHDVTYAVTVACDTATVTLTSTGTAGAATTVTEAQYVRNGKTTRLRGAITSSTGGLWLSHLDLTSPGTDGHIVLDSGDFNCNNTSEIHGDVIVRGGNAMLSNQCRIRGDLFVSGHVRIDNNAVGVDGDVHAMGGFTLSTSATIQGSVYVRGDAEATSGGRINGHLIATGDVRLDNATTRVGGYLWAGGAVTHNAATVTGLVTSASPSLARFFQGTVGGIRSAGPADIVSTIVTGPVEQNVPVSPPVVSTPWEMGSSAHSWIDVPFTGSWAGYTTTAWTNCHDSSGFVSTTNALSTPTVVDLRGCPNMNLWNASLTIETDVILIVNGMIGQRLKINATSPRSFSIVTPDNTADEAPTCIGNTMIDLYGVEMGDNVSGVAYSPCRIEFGSNGGGRWNGLVYGGQVTASGNSLPRLRLDYQEVVIPGLGDGGTGPQLPHLGALLALRDVQ